MSTTRPTPDPDEQTAPPAQVPQSHALGLSMAQIAGSALAAVTGAVLASWLGVTGTLMGAALGSMVGTIGSATYTYSLRRGHEVIRATRPISGTAAHSVTPATIPHQPPEDAPAWETSRSWRDWPWRRILAAAAVALGIGIAALTAFELLVGEPVSSITGGSDGGRTTIGGVTRRGGSGDQGGGNQQQPTTPASSPSGTVSPSPTSEPTSSPTDQPTTEPTSTPTDTAAPTEEPSESPTESAGQ